MRPRAAHKALPSLNAHIYRLQIVKEHDVAAARAWRASRRPHHAGPHTPCSARSEIIYYLPLLVKHPGKLFAWDLTCQPNCYLTDKQRGGILPARLALCQAALSSSVLAAPTCRSSPVPWLVHEQASDHNNPFKAVPGSELAADLNWPPLPQCRTRRGAWTGCSVPRCGDTLEFHAWRDKLWVQVLHGCAGATETARRAIQAGQESVRALARGYGIGPTTVQKWRRRSTMADAPMGPKQRRSTVLSPEQEAAVVAFRRHTQPLLDDCPYALQPSMPQLTRSTLHHRFERHGVVRLP